MAVHFHVLQESKERLLFSIRELSDGSLVLIHGAYQTNFGSGEQKKIKDLHVTAHTARLHDDGRVCGHKLKTTLLTTENERFDKSIIVGIGRDGKRPKFLWIWDTAVYGMLNGPAFDVKAKQKDEIVQLIGFMGALNVLCYTILVHDKTIMLPHVQGCSLYRRDFTSLSISIYITFYAADADDISMHNYHLGGTQRRGPEIITEQSKIQTPLHSKHSETIVREMISTVVVQYMKQRGPRAYTGDRLKRWGAATDFQRWPAFFDMEHFSYGILSRIRNDPQYSKTFVDGVMKPAGYVEPRSSTIIIQAPKKEEGTGSGN